MRHYWDGEANGRAGGLYIAFAHSRLQYGFEYDGRPLDAAASPSLASAPNLLNAVGALSTSPVVSMGMPHRPGGGAGGSCRDAVASLASLAGKYHVAADLTADSTPHSIARWVGQGCRGSVMQEVWGEVWGLQAFYSGFAFC